MILRFLTSSITLIVFFFGVSTTAAKMTAKVAVLPFEVYSGESPEYLRDTLAQELSDQVATEEQIAVVDQAAVKKLLESESPLNLNEFTLRDISEKLQESHPNKLLLWYHLFACESHYDAIATALGVLSGELDDMRTSETHQLSDEMMPWSIGLDPS